jgi:CDP-glucose 4,6-dehydratase
MDDVVIKTMFGDAYQNKKVLITGNTGFKGSWLTLWLLKLGARVIGVSKDIPTKPSMFDELNISDQVIHYKKDVRDLEAIKKIVEDEKPDFIFHLAAQALVSLSYSNPIETMSTNIMGVANILDALKTLNRNCVCIVITSDKCYDNVEWVWGYKETDALGGKDIYSGSKGAAELVFKSYYHSFFQQDDCSVKIATTRAGNVIGGGDWAADRIVPDCMRAWSQNKIVEIRSPDATRPWQHVLEPLSGYLTLGQKIAEGINLSGENFNFGPLSQYNQTVIALLEDLSEQWDFQYPSESYRIVDNRVFHEASLLKLNCDKTLFSLKWLPALGYEKLIEFTGSWYYKYYHDRTNMLQFTLSQIGAYEKIASEQGIEWTK